MTTPRKRTSEQNFSDVLEALRVREVALTPGVPMTTVMDILRNYTGPNYGRGLGPDMKTITRLHGRLAASRQEEAERFELLLDSLCTAVLGVDGAAVSE